MSSSVLISEKDIWRTAAVMLNRYGADAAEETKARADKCLKEGDAIGHAVWRRVLRALEGLQQEGPKEAMN